MQVFTSVAVNYLPKARVLARSLKRFHPDAKFHVVLCDAVPAGLRESLAPFDSLTHVEELPLENIRQWIFKHTLVELCTAVKGALCQKLMDAYPQEPLLYLDPDMVVLAPLDPLLEQLQHHDILLTPHQTEPDSSTNVIIDNEISSLRHGTYNLGFLGLAPTAEARRFVDWWAARLRHFCYAEIENGLFTDQRWVDLAPAFFPTLQIHRDPGCNVATWNLSNRQVTGAVPYGLLVNGQPLRFFHFSGLDSGAQKTMLDKFGGHSPVLYELRDWYAAQCQQEPPQPAATWQYDCFDNGVPITRHQRTFYRSRDDVRTAFPDPFATHDTQRSYYHWYLVEVTSEPLPESAHRLRDEVLRQRREVGRLVKAQEKLAELNAAVLATNDSILTDNSLLTKAIDEINAVNQQLTGAYSEQCLSQQEMLQINQQAHEQAHQVSDQVRHLNADLETLRSRNQTLGETVAALQQHARGLQQQLEEIHCSRSYRAARRVSALVHGVWRRTA